MWSLLYLRAEEEINSCLSAKAAFAAVVSAGGAVVLGTGLPGSCGGPEVRKRDSSFSFWEPVVSLRGSRENHACSSLWMGESPDTWRTFTVWTHEISIIHLIEEAKTAHRISPKAPPNRVTWTSFPHCVLHQWSAVRFPSGEHGPRSLTSLSREASASAKFSTCDACKGHEGWSMLDLLYS